MCTDSNRNTRGDFFSIHDVNVPAVLDTLYTIMMTRERTVIACRVGEVGGAVLSDDSL